MKAHAVIVLHEVEEGMLRVGQTVGKKQGWRRSEVNKRKYTSVDGRTDGVADWEGSRSVLGDRVHI